MSVYATVAADHVEWFISVAVFMVEEPVRVNHGDEEWYLDKHAARELWHYLDGLYGNRDQWGKT